MSADPQAAPAPASAPEAGTAKPWWVEYKSLIWWGATLLITAVASAIGGWQMKPADPPAPQPLVNAEPLDYEGARFGGCDHDHGPQPLVEAARWPVDRITYSVDYATAKGLNPPLSDGAIQSALKQAAGWWSENLQIELVEVPAGTGAHIPIKFERIDGALGVLAEAYLANGNLQPKPLRFDNGERWTAGPPAANLVSLPTVACHELGHSLGLDHDAPNAPAVMRPSYTASIPREQERDIARAVGLGYKRRDKVPAAPSDVLSFPVQARTDEVVEALKKAGFTVTKP